MRPPLLKGPLEGRKEQSAGQLGGGWPRVLRASRAEPAGAGFFTATRHPRRTFGASGKQTRLCVPQVSVLRKAEVGVPQHQFLFHHPVEALTANLMIGV